MFASIVTTALTLHYSFALLGLTPESGRSIEETAQFAIDYTFFLNILFVGVAGGLVWLHRRYVKEQMEGKGDEMEMGGFGPKRIFALVALAILIGGIITFFVTAGSG